MIPNLDHCRRRLCCGVDRFTVSVWVDMELNEIKGFIWDLGLLTLEELYSHFSSGSEEAGIPWMIFWERA